MSPRRFFFSQGAELFRRLITWIARSGFLCATSRCHLIAPECPSNDFEIDKHGTETPYAREHGSPCGEMGGAIRYPSLSTPESFAVTAIYCERYSLRRGNVTAPCNLSAVKMRRREKRTEAKEEKEKKYESRGSIVNLTHFSERRRIKLPFVCLLFSHDSHLYSRSRGIRIFYSRLRYEAGESVIEIRVARKRGTRDET